jgi:hypothetical protein
MYPTVSLQDMITANDLLGNVHSWIHDNRYLRVATKNTSLRKSVYS